MGKEKHWALFNLTKGRKRKGGRLPQPRSLRKEGSTLNTRRKRRKRKGEGRG